MTKVIEVEPGRLARGGVLVVGEDESVDDRTARIAREKQDQEHRIWNDKILFRVIVTAGVAIFVICGFIAFFGEAAFDPTSRDFAKVTFSALVSGFLSFLVGQKMR